jgi:hypothetical protein
MLEKRRAMMDAWAAFVESVPSGNVVRLESGQRS